jgi:hypothetical protein
MNMRRLVLPALAITVSLGLLGCPKKDTPVVVVDSGPPVVVDAAPTEIKPLDELDAGDDADANDAAKKPTGPGLTTSQLRAKQCCNALRNQAKALGNSPESAQLLGLAATCDTIALQLGPTKGGAAPELEPIRQILKGKTTLPPLCSGL